MIGLPAYPRPLVKVCGLTRLEDVVLAAELGAWAIGFVFARSPRQVTVEVARWLVPAAREAARGGPDNRGARPGPLTVGVFGDTSTEAIADIVDAVGLDAVQLHGSRPDASALREAIGEREARPLIIRAVPVPAGASPSDASPSDARLTGARRAAAGAGEGCDLLLFDTRVGNRWGGTGTTFPWQIAREAAGDMPYLVAGGLGPHNIREALAASGAWGADVSSGVEQSPGVKDEALLRALFAAVAGIASGSPAVVATKAACPAAMNEQRREGTTS